MYRALAATRPELVDRLIVIGLPHPVAWGDNMSFSQARKLHLRVWHALYCAAAPHVAIRE